MIIIETVCFIIGVAVIFILIYILSIKPRIFNRPDMSPLYATDGLFAHRGLYGNGIKENTAEAFKLAVKQGYGIELDIRLSSDKIPVVIHDATLLRVFGIDRRVDSMTAAEIAAENVPMLYDVLRIIGGKVPLIVEIKVDWSDIAICLAASGLLDDYNGPYCIESFNPLVLMWYKKNRCSVIRGQIATAFKRDGEKGNLFLYFALQHLLLNFMTVPDFIAYKHFYASVLSLKLCRKLYRIPAGAWTIKNEEELLDCRNKKFNFFIFENFQPNKQM